MRFRLPLLSALTLVSALIVTSAVTSTAYAASGSSAASNFCDRAHQLTAAQQDRILRFAGVVREELAAVNSDTCLLYTSDAADE